MNEVSCRAIECVLPLLEERGIPVERVLEGLPVSLGHLHDSTQRIDWDVNVEIVQRSARLLGPGGAELIGRRSVQAAPFQLYRLLGMVVADAHFLYRMAARWMGPSFFSHIRFGYTELPDGRIRLEIEIPAGYRGCPELFDAFASSFRILPGLVGRTEAAVEAEISSHRGVFTIRAPRRASLRSWLRSLLRLPGAARAAVEEVAREQHHVSRALDEVRQAHAELRSHVEQIASLDRLGRSLSRQLGSEQIPDRILEFLNLRFGWRGSSLSMQASEAAGLLFFGQSGAIQGAPSCSYPLADDARVIGRLEVWRAESAAAEADGQQLEKLLPWIAMTVLNARFAAGVRSDTPGQELRWASKSGHDLFLILDENARILYAGPRVDEILGYEADDLQHVNVVKLIHPDDRPRLVRQIEDVSKYSSSAFYSRLRLQTRGGDFLAMEGVAIKVLSESGASVYLVSCGADAERGPAH